MRPQPCLADIILVRPQEEGNVGAVARAMANMGLDTLLLVEPAVELGRTAAAFAVGARPLLEHSRRTPDLATALAPYRRIVATTSARGRDLGAPVLAPRELPAALAADPPGTPTALVFGPEPSGLTREELAHASLLVTIPAAPEHPTLNLAQAVLILTYELHLERRRRVPEPPVEPAEPAATAAELDGLLAHAERVLEKVGFARDDTFAGVLSDLRRLAARAAPRPREVAILRGVCRRIERRLERLAGG